MKTFILSVSLFVAGAAFGSLALPHLEAASAQSSMMSGMGNMNMNSMSASDEAYMSAMHNMDKAMMSARMTGNPDHDFLTMMIPHHDGAIAMARVELKYGKNSTVKAAAQKALDENMQGTKELRSELQSL